MSGDQAHPDLSMQDVADLLGVHQGSVTRMAQRGALSRYLAANGTWRVPYAEVERMLAARRLERRDRADRARALARLRAQLRSAS